MPGYLFGDLTQHRPELGVLRIGALRLLDVDPHAVLECANEIRNMIAIGIALDGEAHAGHAWPTPSASRSALKDSIESSSQTMPRQAGLIVMTSAPGSHVVAAAIAFIAPEK